MQLVLVDNHKVVKIYEDNCTPAEIDQIFEDYIRLKRIERHMKEPITLSGANLDGWIETKIQNIFDEATNREKIRQRADQFWRLKAESTRAQVKTWFLEKIQKWFKRKKPEQ